MRLSTAATHERQCVPNCNQLRADFDTKAIIQRYFKVTTSVFAGSHSVRVADKPVLFILVVEHKMASLEQKVALLKCMLSGTEKTEGNDIMDNEELKGKNN